MPDPSCPPDVGGCYRVIDRFRLPRSPRRSLVVLVATSVVAAVPVGCGGDGTEGAQIRWIPGTPPGEVAQIQLPVPTEATSPTATAADAEAATTAPTPTMHPAAAPTATAPAQNGDPVTGRKLTAQELKRFKPDELGQIPVIEYHNLVADPADEAQFARPIADFRT